MRIIEEMEIIKRIQAKTLEMLKTLSGLLEANGIPFWLAYGTALGCARHRGFIPWDDDVDIYIKGTDYSRLRKLFDEGAIPDMALHDPETVPGYPFWFPKIVATDTLLVEKSMRHLPYRCGVYIDVFLLAQDSRNVLVRKFHGMRRYLDYCILHACYSNFKSLPRKCVSMAARMFCSPEKAQRRLYRRYAAGPGDDRRLVDTGLFGKKALLKADWFREVVYMPFEDAVMPMPSAYEDYLTHCYGDWKTPPPEEERVSGHDFAVAEFY